MLAAYTVEVYLCCSLTIRVTLPLASTVITGMLIGSLLVAKLLELVLPYVPAVTPDLANVTGTDQPFLLPADVPVASPVNVTVVLALNWVAVDALPSRVALIVLGNFNVISLVPLTDVILPRCDASLSVICTFLL